MRRTRLIGNTYLVEGGAGSLPQVRELLEREGVRMRGNPDVYVREYVRFGADDARELQERAVLRPAGAGRRVFVIVAPTMTTEAQNVLLKTLEEPPADALFMFLVAAPQALLPTLRSRAQALALSAVVADGDHARVFLSAPAAKRLDLLKPLLDKREDDVRDVRPILSFLADLERELASFRISEPVVREGLRAIYRARRFATDKGALLKPLMEQVALIVPEM